MNIKKVFIVILSYFGNKKKKKKENKVDNSVWETG